MKFASLSSRMIVELIYSKKLCKRDTSCHAQWSNISGALTTILNDKLIFHNIEKVWENRLGLDTRDKSQVLSHCHIVTINKSTSSWLWLMMFIAKNILFLFVEMQSSRTKYSFSFSFFPFQVYYSINKNINHRDRESRGLSIDLSNLCVSSNKSLQSFVKMRQQEPRNPVGMRSRNSNSFTIDSQGNNIPINTVNSSSPDSENVERKPYPMTPSGEFVV